MAWWYFAPIAVLFSVVFILLLTFLLRWAVGGFPAPYGGRKDGGAEFQILRERYAKGEISEDQMEKMTAYLLKGRGKK